MTLVPGANLGAYRIVEQIGRGGMATVYQAYQPALARYVAVKVLPAFLAEEEGFRERFQREAIAVGALRHPHIVAVHDFGEAQGVAYLVTEFVDGGTLAAQLGQPLPLDYVARLLGAVASALDYAHARGVVHRDVKPSNILLARDGTPILSDFGLARMMGSLPRLTQTGTALGTPEYMAPEQAAGEAAGPAADRYALAVVAYEMLTGRVPFTAETPLAVLLAHLHRPLPLPRQVNPALPPGVEAALLTGLAKRAEHRYPTAAAFIQAMSEGGGPALPISVPAAPDEDAGDRRSQQAQELKPATPLLGSGTTQPQVGIWAVPFLMSIAWGVAWFVVWSFAQTTTWLVAWAIGGAVSGLATGAILRQTAPTLSWRQAHAVALGWIGMWASAWLLGWGIARFIDWAFRPEVLAGTDPNSFAFAIGRVAGWACGGLLMGSTVRVATRAGSAGGWLVAVVAFGWAAAGGVGHALFWVLDPALYPPGVRFALSGVAEGAIGGAVTLWQLSRLRRMAWPSPGSPAAAGAAAPTAPTAAGTAAPGAGRQH